MNKNNEYRKMQENIKMPEGLKEKTMLAARQLEENDKNNKKIKKIVPSYHMGIQAGTMIRN